jgi:four helix bundle protein
MDTGLGQRLFDFAVNVIEYCRKLPKAKEYEIIKYQLIKSANSTWANYEEAQGAVAKHDFINKINIALTEIKKKLLD